MLTLERLRERCLAGESFEYLYFWGHQPAKSGAITKSCFSQWYLAPFVINKQFYATAEHWMMASKARLFADLETEKEILESSDPHTAKGLGRKVRNFEESVWNENASLIVFTGNLAKFSQNELLGKFLLSTGEAVLVEASPYDRIWGIGMKQDDERAKHPATWQGANKLGFALMEVRNALQNSSIH